MTRITTPNSHFFEQNRTPEQPGQGSGAKSGLERGGGDIKKRLGIRIVRKK